MNMILDAKSNIVETWNGGYKLELDITAEAQADDWQLDFDFPYEIRAVYGVDLIEHGNGSYSIRGQNNQTNLDAGQSLRPIFIIDDSSQQASPLEITGLDYSNQVEPMSNQVEPMSNQPVLSANSEITEDWQGGYKLELDIRAETGADDWELNFDFPYEIREAYGVDLIDNGNGNYTIRGQNDQTNLNAGQSLRPIFIIDDSGQQTVEFNINESAVSSPEVAPEAAANPEPVVNEPMATPPSVVAPEPAANPEPVVNEPMATPEQSVLSANSDITEDWQGGYKLELDIRAETSANDWELNFDFPYSIRETYGVDLIDNGNGSYTIKGQNNQANLSAGQSLRPIFIVDDFGNQARPFEIAGAQQSNQGSGNQGSGNQGSGNDAGNPPPSNEDVISVEQDFGGDLAAAIAAAQDGQTVQLGNKTYYTSGLTISKDITLDGQSGSIIDGSGTSSAVITLTDQAAGTTIQDLTVTNGNNGIHSDAVENLTLQNLVVHNIGVSNPIQQGNNNVGISIGNADGLRILDTEVYDIGRKGVAVGDTDGAEISGISVRNVNLAAQHAQSHDAAGIKFFNTNDILLRDSHFSDINAMFIWNDTTINTTIENNTVVGVGADFQAPSFNNNVDIHGIYNEKSANSIVRYNEGTSVGNFATYNATAFTTETMIVEDNSFAIVEINTTDFWVNEQAERLIATTEDPSAADFSLFAEEYNDQLVIE